MRPRKTLGYHILPRSPMRVDISAHIPYCQRGNIMGTTREPREDTPVELVEVPLLTVLGVAWRNNYPYGIRTVIDAMREAGIECTPLDGVDFSFGSISRGLNIMVTVDHVIVLIMKRDKEGLHLFNQTYVAWPRVVLDKIVRCRMKLNLAMLDDSERAQLGLEVTP